jgi:hypothetical protein
MTISFTAGVAKGVAITTASAVIWAPSTAPPAPPPVSAHAVTLTAAVVPSTPDAGPTLFDQLGRGIIPSLGAPLPTPPPNTPIVVASSANQGIKNIYNAVEPWVRYGFEVATYAVGWVPYVGWLSPQIMIFYNFGERIVRSITFNVADWLFGPLFFTQGLRNVAVDSWNALVQLGIDQWNFWLPPLPPLPPLPFAATPTAKAAATQTARSTITPTHTAATARGLVTTSSTVNLPAVQAHSSVTRQSSGEPTALRQPAHNNVPSKSAAGPKPH